MGSAAKLHCHAMQPQLPAAKQGSPGRPQVTIFLAAWHGVERIIQSGLLPTVRDRLAVQMAKIDKFTKSQLSTLKKRVKTLREQVKDVKEGEGNNKLTQVSHLQSGTLWQRFPEGSAGLPL